MKPRFLSRALLPLVAVALLASSCPDEVVPVTGVTLNEITTTLEVGQSFQLIPTIYPAEATIQLVTWSSSNESLATVDVNGLVTTLAAGTVKITVTTIDGGKSAICTITIKEPLVAVTSVELDKTTLTMTEGETEMIVATVKPDNASDKTVTWSSSDEAVATVDYFGNVSAVAPGSAEIIVTTVDGGKTATCAVTVNKAVISVASVAITPIGPILTEGETQTLTAIVTPDDADDKSVTWASSNTAVATVDASGVVTAVAPGTADITVTTTDGGKTATTTVIVNAKIIPVEYVDLGPATLTLKEGESFVMAGAVNPSNAADQVITWSSSNPSVATVDDTGKVTAVSEGTATITITSHDGGHTASSVVTVVKNIIHVTSVALNKTTLNLKVGDSEQLTATVKPDDASDKGVVWASTNSAIASVDQTGKVTAVGAGAVTITATTNDGGKIAGCDVTVTVPTVPVTGVALDKTSATLTVGQSLTLTATVSPSDATNKNVTWSSDNPSVATVNAYGIVITNSEGTATITATTVDGGKTATCVVTVVKAPANVESVTLDKTSLALAEGGTATLVASVKPDDADDKSVTWASDNTSVATVDNAGNVTAVAEGSATITVTTTDGGKTATCAVTVSKNVVHVTSVTLNKTELEMTVGETETLVATVNPDNATDKSLTWESSNTKVATVDANGKVTAVSAGISGDGSVGPNEATITVKSNDGGWSASCKVIVKMKTVSVTSVSLNKSEITLEPGYAEQLIATVLPENATNKSVTWESSNTSVAMVYSDGKVEGHGPGEATVTVKTNDGGKTATCKVTVNAPAPVVMEAIDLGLSVKWANMNVGATAPEGYGDYYTWGDTETHYYPGYAEQYTSTSAMWKPDTKGYKWSNCKWGYHWSYTEGSFTKYNTDPDLGTVDNKTALEPEDDVARVVLGGDWRMPTYKEALELIDTYWDKSNNYKWEWTTLNGVEGIRLTYKVNNNTIFFPTAGKREDFYLNYSGKYTTAGRGVGYYWTSDMDKDYNSVYEPWDPYAGSILEVGCSTSLGNIATVSGMSRFMGLPVRAVLPNAAVVHVTGITLDKTNLNLKSGATYTLVATVSPSNATDKSINWTSTNNNVATVDQTGKVTAKNPGNAVIKATTKDGGKVVTCTVTVSAK